MLLYLLSSCALTNGIAPNIYIKNEKSGIYSEVIGIETVISREMKTTEPSNQKRKEKMILFLFMRALTNQIHHSPDY